jgi:hypothetical protein
VTLPAAGDLHGSLTTKEGWRRFVDDVTQPPPVLTKEQLAELDESDQAAHEHARLDHHARLGVVTTPIIRQVLHTGRRLVLLNRHQTSARRGLILTGPAGTGKTTAITQLGKVHEHTSRRRDPQPGPRLPVVYVTVPPAATPRVLAIEFARFLGLPTHVRSNQTEVTNAVCATLCQLRTDLVLVDEIHNLNLASRADAEASDQLKYLSERIPATFVYAGIDVEHVGLFSGIRGRQLAGRFGTLATTPFPYATSTHRQQWQALVATLEQALRLHRHRHGSLLRLVTYLHERTAGMIGSLSHLIRGAAIDAILDGTEQITRASLDAVALDHAADRNHATRRRRATRSRRAAEPSV